MGTLRSNKFLELIYGSNKTPFYVYTPRWVDSSAGIKVLHYLCHSINTAGGMAFIVLSEGGHLGHPRINPALDTPILSEEVAQSHFESGITPVTIYSETVPGNPLDAPFVMRYLLNFTGALGGQSNFESDEFIVAFSQSIADHYCELTDVITPVLFLPPVDPREVIPTTHKIQQQAVYAGKYRSFVGTPPSIGSLPSVEIFRDGPKMQSRTEVLKILGESSRVYLFENSSIATEAILSGTPVHFVPNQFLGSVIAETELGNYGVALSDCNEDFQTAFETLSKAEDVYNDAVTEFPGKLKEILEAATVSSRNITYLQRINVPKHKHVVNSHRLNLAMQILRFQGFTVLARVMYHFVLRRLAWRFWRNKGKTMLRKSDRHE